MTNKSATPLPRRDFLTRSAAALAATSVLGFPAIVRADNDKILKLGIVGCGGRGTGAIGNALSADKNVILTAMGDVVRDRIYTSHENISKTKPDQVKVEEGKKFVGLDAIDEVLKTDVDVVILTTPPGFRPQHLKKAVAAGKHVFCEKPVAVDAPGVRDVIATAAEAKKKGLGIQSGFCWRSNYGERAIFEQILQKDAIGKVRSYYGTYLANSPWVKERKPEWTDLEWQLRNWLYFTWLSGDHLVEQAIHTVDKMSWAFGDIDPISATAMGGRQQRIEEQYGMIYDHFSVAYEYPEGARGFVYCRQQAGCDNENADEIIGADGTARINGFRKLRTISGKNTWKYEGPANDMYQTEHEEMFAAIRKGQPLNYGEKLAHSTLMGIMGRMSAYTGKTITWEQALKSEETLAPKEALEWNMKLPVPPVPMPGRTKFL
jgi:myo-inositol 2-dehydrogenase / D-chiro-inositol 1-dehydrogenase